MKKTNVILYTPGAYGYFINWCCEFFFGNIADPKIPFSDLNNLHTDHLGGRPLLGCKESIENYLNSDFNFEFVKMHEFSLLNFLDFEVTDYFKILDQNLDMLLKHFSRVIYIYPTKSSVLWITNNAYYKGFFERSSTDNIYLCDQFMNESLELEKNSRFLNIQKTITALGIDRLKIILNYECSTSDFSGWGHTSIDDFQIWELRELASHNLYNRETGSILTDDQISHLKEKFKDILFVELDQLRDNFTEALTNIINHFNLPVDKINSIPSIQNQWFPRQSHIFKDYQVDNIVNKIINNIKYDWTDLNITFIDECFIQRKLRDAGFALKCYNLDVFPTNTYEFQKYLI